MLFSHNEYSWISRWAVRVTVGGLGLGLGLLHIGSGYSRMGSYLVVCKLLKN